MSCRIVALFLLLVICLQTAWAQELSLSSESALAWIKKMTDAPRQHNFSGTFVYYADSQIETSRIVHKIDKSGEHEKIEVLDGMPRIVFRHNDEMRCYLPESKKVYTERRWFRKFFPDYILYPADGIDKNYHITEARRERVAGRESQVLSLIPRDSLRFGYQFWIDSESGLLLKVTVTHGNEVIEQFAFAQLEIDSEISSEQVNPDVSMISNDWKITNLTASLLNKGELKWEITSLPVGFRKLVEMKRNLTEKPTLVDHIALTDGLATVSIFIEPIDKNESPMAGLFSSRGAINIYVRTVEANKITTIGEVPLETIKLIGDAVIKQK
ncbi:MucB/RseB C-terminal domain-containing protein [Nitrosomonas sp.]|uniref:MucB/RseB C-terminal domain-containing protein n=1 Tax=Nitrosomonas sp. TaxID=42353 RepID=UPI0025EC3106|nr:MucB/RseB C-terminal domain-containing protein [Nitrosomonas sp.]